MNYSDVAFEYKKIAMNQATAGEKLISLIKFAGTESVLDLGCGTGHLSFKLKQQTSGEVIGVDSSDEMIRQANNAYGSVVKFICQPGEKIHFAEKFDIVFCNSVLHWFKDPTIILSRLKEHLSTNGIFALQTPVENWCAFIIEVIEDTCQTTRFHPFMRKYTNPWFHLRNAAAYKELLEDNGFHVNFEKDETVVTENCDIEKIVGLFNSGPALAYLNPENYAKEWDSNFKSDFIAILRQKISDRIKNPINISYNRAYLISRKKIYDGK